jgi:hypothetical protein
MKSSDIHSLKAFAETLLREDRVLDAVALLVQPDQFHLSRAHVLLGLLMENCTRKHQTNAIGYLLEEFAPVYPPALEAPLRFKQHAMYVRFGDAEGIARVIRRLAQMDSTE